VRVETDDLDEVSRDVGTAGDMRDRITETCRMIIWASVGLYAFFLPWGVTGVQIALGLGVLAWIVKSVAQGRVEWIGKPVGRPVLLFLLLFLYACVAGWVWAETMRELASLRTLLAIFLVASNLRSADGLRRLALLLVAGLAAFSLYAATARVVMVARDRAMYAPLVVSKAQLERIERDRQKRVEDFERRQAEGLEQERARPDAFWLPDVGSMSEAGQLAMAVPFALAVLLGVRNRKWRLVLMAALIILVLNLILNMKRGAWMACLTALIALAAIERRRRILAVIAALIVVGALLPAVRTRAVEAFTGQDGQRLALWRAVPKVVLDEPLGVGPGCSHHVLKTKKYVPPDVYYALPDKVHFHSTIAELAVCAGPLTVGAYVWWFVAFGAWAFRMLRRMQQDSPARAIVLGGLVAAVAFFINGLVEYNLGDSDVTLMLYLTTGMAMAAVPNGKARDDSKDSVEANDGEG